MKPILAQNVMELPLVLFQVVHTFHNFLQVVLVHDDSIAVGIAIRGNGWFTWLHSQCACLVGGGLVVVVDSRRHYLFVGMGLNALFLEDCVTVLVVQVLKPLDLFEFMRPQV